MKEEGVYQNQQENGEQLCHFRTVSAVSSLHELSALHSTGRFMSCMRHQASLEKSSKDWSNIRDIGARGFIRERAFRRKMAASFRVLAKGKLSTMQPALRAVISRANPVVLSRGLAVTSK